MRSISFPPRVESWRAPFGPRTSTVGGTVGGELHERRLLEPGGWLATLARQARLQARGLELRREVPHGELVAALTRRAALQQIVGEEAQVARRSRRR